LGIICLVFGEVRMMTIFLETGCAIWRLPRYSADSSRSPAHKLLKGGTRVRGASENYPMSYLMFVLYALVIIVLAAVFLL
jgi:hypothetical protein